MLRRFLYSIFVFLLLVDIGYSFVQHLGQPLDGDMSGLIVPADYIKPVLNSPLGLDVIIKNHSYSNPNRFFCHWMFFKYFNTIPFYLQKFVQPIDSMYLSCAIIKTIIQILLIFLMAFIVSGTRKILNMNFIIAAILITPFFQTNGYYLYMAIIDPSITYTFFYALPCLIFLLYLLPFISSNYYHKKLPYPLQVLINIIWIPLALVICLSGPLNPGIALVFSLLVFLGRFIKEYKLLDKKEIKNKLVSTIINIPKSYWFYLLPICLFSLYSLYLGQANTFNISMPLSELYLRIPQGIYYQFTSKIGFPILFVILILNTIIINKKIKSDEGKKILKVFKWIGLFALVYILLLPLGGFREYRPNVLRYDTIMPITLSLIFVFGTSTLYILKKITAKQKLWYIPIIVAVLLTFTIADEPNFKKNSCEKQALKEIAESKKNIVKVNCACSILEWHTIQKPEQSEMNSQLLLKWNITREKKLYYNE